MIQKDGSILINEWDNLGDSPFNGAMAIINADTSEQGVFKASIERGSTNTKTGLNYGGIAEAMDTRFGDIISVYDNGVIEDSVLGSVQSAQAGSAYYDIVYVGEGVFFYSYVQGGDGKIGAIYKSAPGSISIQSAKISGLVNDYIKLIYSRDGKIYYSNGNKIGCISSWNVTTGTVNIVTNSPNVLDLPKGYAASCFADLGRSLLIGVNTNSWNSRALGRGFLYTWDRNSASFNTPVEVQANGINAMIQLNNMVYFSAGTSGEIYVTDGTSYRLIKKINPTRNSVTKKNINVMPNAMTGDDDGNILIGVSGGSNDNTAPYVYSYYDRFGVYKIDSKNGYKMQMLCNISTGNMGNNGQITFGCVTPKTLYYKEGASFKKETLVTGSITPNTTAIYESALMIVGDRIKKKTYNNLMIQMINPMSTLSIDGVRVRILFRENLHEAWREILNKDAQDIPDQYSHEDKALITMVEKVQLRIEISNENGKRLGSEIALISVKLT